MQTTLPSFLWCLDSGWFHAALIVGAAAWPPSWGVSWPELARRSVERADRFRRWLSPAWVGAVSGFVVAVCAVVALIK
jgi:hypothetical protein